jgi:poly(A) polymerase
VPDATDDAELLTRAAVGLNRHGHVLREIGGRFALAGRDLFLVGGSVRDAVLGRQIPDLDFTTDARPDEIQHIVRPWADAIWDTGIEYGTVGAGKAGRRLEITTFRADSYDQVSRNPEVRFGDRLEDDLVRRDFTANAMAVRITPEGPGEFLDPLGGLAAVRRRMLDTPAEPSVSFGDDPLRMLRAARFVSQLEFGVADRVREAIVAMAPQLARITVERVAVELDKMLLGVDPVAGIELMVQTGMGEVVLPEVGGMRMAIDEHHQHKDVYQHSLTVLRQAIELEGPPRGQERSDSGEGGGPDLVLRWAALLHDIGKPATRRHEADGGVSFHHHEVVGAKMVRKRMRELKYSKQMVDDVSQLVYLHLRFHGYGEGRWTDSAVRRYVTDAGPLLDRPTTAASSNGSLSSAPGRTWPGCGPTSTATQSWRSSAFRPARRSARPGSTSRNSGWIGDRCPTRRRPSNCCRGGAPARRSDSAERAGRQVRLIRHGLLPGYRRRNGVDVDRSAGYRPRRRRCLRRCANGFRWRRSVRRRHRRR